LELNQNLCFFNKNGVFFLVKTTFDPFFHRLFCKFSTFSDFKIKIFFTISTFFQKSEKRRALRNLKIEN